MKGNVIFAVRRKDILIRVVEALRRICIFIVVRSRLKVGCATITAHFSLAAYSTFSDIGKQ